MSSQSGPSTAGVSLSQHHGLYHSDISLVRLVVNSELCSDGGSAWRWPVWQLPMAASLGSAAWGQKNRLHNKALHLTKGAWSSPSISPEGRSLWAPFAGERRCSAGL
jgi:hypothetical protein